MTVANCGLQEFRWNIDSTVPRVLIAVDDLLLESDELDAAARTKVAGLVQKYQTLANEGYVCLTLFSTNWIKASSLNDVERIFDQDVLGSPDNRWAHLFSKITQVYRNYTQDVKVFIISSMQNTETTLKDQLQNFEQCPPNEDIKLHFCQIGDTDTSYFKEHTKTNPRIGKVSVRHEFIKKPTKT